MRKHVRLFGLVFFSLVLTVCGISRALTLAEVQKAIRDKGASWKASDSSLSRLQRKQRLGAKIEPGIDEPFAEVGNRPSSAPARWDWRDQGGVNFVSPIRDQGQCGSCVAFAAIATMETQLNVTWKTPLSPWLLSPQHLFACGGGICEEGWTLGDASTALKDSGVPEESCFPYQSGSMGEDLACKLSCSDSGSRLMKIASYTMPTFIFASVDKVKAALLKGPVMTAMKVYEDFFYYKEGVYKHVTGDLEGGHAVSLVGWDDSTKSWIARNSWGTGWGEKGFFRIAWDDPSGAGNQTYQFRVAEPDGFVAVEGVADRAVYDTQLNFSARSTFKETSSLSWELRRAGNVAASGTIPLPAVNLRNVRVDTSSLNDGEYELSARAETSAGVKVSPRYQVGILHGKLTGLLKIEGLTEGGKVSGDTAKMEFVIDSSPIRLERIVFWRKELATGETTERATPNVAPRMKMNWHIGLAPTGKYQVGLYGLAGHQKIVSAPLEVTVER